MIWFQCTDRVKITRLNKYKMYRGCVYCISKQLCVRYLPLVVLEQSDWLVSGL